MKSLHDADGGLAEVVALGAPALLAVSEILFARDPSGLFQVRCRAVDALAALKAFPILSEFLRTPRDVRDPVERLGDDVVVSAAARAMAQLREPCVYELLAEVARERPLQGVLAGLGSFFRPDTIPVFIDALMEDELRLTAEAILRGFGVKARAALLAAARELGDPHSSESESHLRKRRSAMALLSDIGVSRREWPSLRPLLDHADHATCLYACAIGLRSGNAADRGRIETRLRQLAPSVCWIHRAWVDELLRAVATKTGVENVGVRPASAA